MCVTVPSPRGLTSRSGASQMPTQRTVCAYDPLKGGESAMKNVYCGLALVFVLLASGGQNVGPAGRRRAFESVPLSARADMVSGGDVLVRVSVPASIPAGPGESQRQRRGHDVDLPPRRIDALLDGAGHRLEERRQRAGGGRRQPLRRRTPRRDQPSRGRADLFRSARTAVHLRDRELQAAVGRDAGQAARRELFDQDARRLLLPLDGRRRPQAVDDA